VKALLIAGTASGVGKTTVASGIMGALARRGMRVQPFKVGPDYIDPTYHSMASGNPSRNLDSWMLAPSTLVELFHHAMRDKEIAVIEGVMGLYDGRSGESDEGSSAQVAKLLRAPVVLVVDASKMARSAAATVLGYQSFDPSLQWAGVILNNVASPGHLEMLRVPIEGATGLPVLGYLPRSKELELPERHLGLIPTTEGQRLRDFLDRLAAQVEQTVDLERLLQMAFSISSMVSNPETSVFPVEPRGQVAAIAVARDNAFSFYYEDSLDLLRAWGADILFFSPLEDRSIPKEATGVYLGGGFPELYAQGLMENEPMRESLRQAARQGMPIYGECGGLMYLGQGITDFQGARYGMVGLIPAWSSMENSRLTLGYRRVRSRGPGPLLRDGEEVRGHEFHWSVLESAPPMATAAYEILDQGKRPEGFRMGSVLASYVHLHLAAKKSLAPNFVDTCLRWHRSHRDM